ncbi:MAG: AI-2E family transporter [Calditrichaeota bacterium]|nr:AI-2E family transporter [Calditrichota bacterium]
MRFYYIRKKSKRKTPPVVRDSKTVKISLAVLVVFAVGFILHLLQAIFKPLFIAIILSYIFEPLINVMRRIKIPKVVAIVVVLVITFVFFYLVGLIIYANVAAFSAEFPKYQAKFNDLYLKIIGMLEIPREQIVAYYQHIDWGELLQKLSIPSLLSSSIGSFINFIANIFLILLFTVYILLGREHLISNIAKAFPGKRSQKIYYIMGNINDGIQKYFFAKTLISLGTGLSATVILLIFGVDFAWIWGLLTFLLNFIPNIGSIIATAPPILVAIFQFGSFFPAVWVGSLLIGVQITWGNIVEPSVMGKSLNMSPLVVIVSLIFWGFVWGPIGMILAVPISSTIQIICRNIDPLKPIAILIAEE